MEMIPFSTSPQSQTNEIIVNLPTLHRDQVKAFYLPGKRKAIRCGRRWGKTEFAKTIGCDAVVRGQSVGWFAPDYKIQSEAYTEMVDILAPVISSANQNAGVLRTLTQGRMDFWTLENERAGRSRKYHRVIIDEAAFTKPNMMSIWELSIEPTLLDYNGDCLVLSNTNGNDIENFFYQICNEPSHGFVTYHAPTSANPLLPLRRPNEHNDAWLFRRQEMLDKLIADHPPLVYQQEYLAEFVDWSGVAFFSLAKLLENEQPVEYPAICDTVLAVVDTATKTGKENDGTAVLFAALSTYTGKPSLVLLDWDYIQIEGALLESWIPWIFKHCEDLSDQCHARFGSSGVFIEDKNSGMVLLQQGENRGWPTHAIESKLTAMGKVERAINCSGYVYQDLVRLSRAAFDKVTKYKTTTRNHLVSQIVGFRPSNKDPVDDDLLDTFCYMLMLTLGQQTGF
jgi:hypothetical protein